MATAGNWALICCSMLLLMPPARADAVTDWNAAACQILLDAGVPPGPAHRALAIIHTAMYQAAHASAARPGVDMQAALAASGRATLLALVPSGKEAAEATYTAALKDARLDAAAAAAGIVAGEAAAAAVLAARRGDGADVDAEYLPGSGGAGEYVPTVAGAAPVALNWGRRQPWLMPAAGAFRPPPPPALSSAAWSRDLQELREFGGRASARRSAADTATARFWAANAPVIFYGLARGLAQAPGRSMLRNARLYAALGQAADDASIAVFDAKYHYRFWRPVTAIRLADPTWTPLLETPLHPEYPCAHCAIASVFATVLQADLGRASPPLLETSSPSANGERRQWATPAALVGEVAQARIHGGIHFRSSTEAGVVLGQRVGDLAARTFQLGSD